MKTEKEEKRVEKTIDGDERVRKKKLLYCDFWNERKQRKKKEEETQIGIPVLDFVAKNKKRRKIESKN